MVSIVRSRPNAITFTLSGTVDDTGDLFDATPINFTLTATQEGGPGSGVSASFRTTTVPEPSTWIMMLLGFAGIGYACHHRARQSALTIA